MDVETIRVLLTAITGGGGAIVISVLWVKSTIKQNEELISVLREKDQELVGITREAVGCIEASLSKSGVEKDFRDRLETLLFRIERRLEETKG